MDVVHATGGGKCFPVNPPSSLPVSKARTVGSLASVSCGQNNISDLVRLRAKSDAHIRVRGNMRQKMVNIRLEVLVHLAAEIVEGVVVRR